MAIHYSILAWEIPWTEEPGRLQSTGSQDRYDLATKPQQQKLFLKVVPLFNRPSYDFDNQTEGIEWTQKK